MPGTAYNSLQSPRMYEALRKQGYSKQAAARISNARTRVRRKAANWDAGAGGQIAGNLYRGAGGRFTAGSGGNTTPAQQRQSNRTGERNTYGREEDARREAEDAAIAAEPNRTKRARLRAATILARRKRLYARREQRRQMDEADQQSRNQEREARAQATAQRRAARVAEVLARREAQRQAREAKPKEPKAPPKPKKPTPEEQRATNRATVRSEMAKFDSGLSPAGFDALMAFAEGATIDARYDTGLREMGILEGDPPRLSSAGRQAVNAANRGDYRGAVDAVNKGQERAKATAIKRQNAEDEHGFRAIEDTLLEKAADGTARAALRRRFVKERRDRKQRRQAGERVQPPKQRDVSIKSFSVFKDSRGQDCWACITTSAYEDRDTEIITRKGLAYLVATAKATGDLGTLNYWHTKLVLGDCTFQALSDDGIFLIEAGTFRTKAGAELGRRMTRKGWRMSPGFLRPATEPYQAVVKGRRVGLYDHPVIFERSPCPPGRASNLYTPFIAKETVVTDEQLRMLKSMAPDLAEQLLAQVQTQKAAADQANAVLKGDTAESLPLYELDGQHYTVKAGKLMPLVEAKAEMAPEAMVEAGETETEDGLADEGLDVDEPLLSPGDIQAIAAAVLEAITPIFDIQKQIGELKNAMGGSLPAPATKEITYQPTYTGHTEVGNVAANPAPVQVVETVKTTTPIEALQAQVASLEATIKAMRDDQPEAAISRPTQSPDTVVTADNPLLAGYKGLSVESSPEEKVKAFLSGFPGFNGNGVFGQ